MAAPTLISYTEANSTPDWTDSTTPKSTPSISWQTNDVIVVLSANEIASASLGLPTATGLTFTNRQSITGSSICIARIDTAVAGSNGSGAISNTSPGGFHWGFAVWVFRGSAGFGNSAKQSTSTRTVSLTPTGADGAIVWGVFDFGASAVTNWNATPTPTNVRQRSQDGGAYTYYISDLADQTSAGAVSYGIAGTGAGTGPYSIVVLEIKASASATDPPFNINQGIPLHYQPQIVSI